MTLQTRGQKTGPPDKTSNVVSVPCFLAVISVTLGLRFLFLRGSVSVTVSGTGFRYYPNWFALLPAPSLGELRVEALRNALISYYHITICCPFLALVTDGPCKSAPSTLHSILSASVCHTTPDFSDKCLMWSRHVSHLGSLEQEL